MVHTVDLVRLGFLGFTMWPERLRRLREREMGRGNENWEREAEGPGHRYRPGPSAFLVWLHFYSRVLEIPRPPDNKLPSTDPFHRHTVPSGLFELLLFLVAKTLYQ